MSQIRPDSTIKLYKVPDIDTSAGRTGIWANANEREAYFSAHALASEYPCTVLKKRVQTIKVATPLETLEGCNYLSFINPSYGNKIFYGHILLSDYLNNNTSIVTYEIDWYITDMFNAKFEPTNMLREGLTSREYNALKANPFNEDYNDKMLSEEPLLCDRRTERMRYNIADMNVMSPHQFDIQTDEYDGWNLTKQYISVYEQMNPNSSPNKYNGKYDLMPEGETYNVSHTKESDDTFIILCYSEVNDTVQAEISAFYNDIIEATEFLDKLPFLLTSPHGDLSYQSPLYFDNYGLARSRRTSDNDPQGLSYTRRPLTDTKLPRPYYMIGTPSLSIITSILEVFNKYDATSSILSLYAMPVHLLDEFVGGSFDHPTLEINTMVNIPFPQSYRNKYNYDSPKLNHFPFTYMSLDGPNDSGHIELKYEKMTEEQGDTGIPLGLNRISFYCTFRKFVSITADGIYVGVTPYDYDNRYHDTEYDGQFVLLRQDLSHGLFYTDFPQIPYTTDAYLTFLAKQAKGMVAADTEYTRLQAGNEYGILDAKIFNNKLGGVKDILDNAASGMSLQADSLVRNTEIFNQYEFGSDYGRVQAGIHAYGEGFNAIGGAASKGVSMLSAGASRSAANAQLKNAQNELVANRRILESAGGYLNNPQSGNPFTENYARAAKAFVADEYHAGSCSGVLNYLKYVQSIGVYLTIRSRSEAFTRLYDMFFKMYGYTTKQYKVPSVAYYLNGNTSANEAPHFENVSYNSPYNDEPEDVFYTQTERCKVTGVCGESARYIENLLNGGVLFVKLQ